MKSSDIKLIKLNNKLHIKNHKIFRDVYIDINFHLIVERLNIARGTTDPEIDSETWTKLGNNMAPLALVANLATRWHHLY